MSRIHLHQTTTVTPGRRALERAFENSVKAIEVLNSAATRPDRGPHEPAPVGDPVQHQHRGATH
jgi:hypothetical protein